MFGVYVIVWAAIAAAVAPLGEPSVTVSVNAVASYATVLLLPPLPENVRVAATHAGEPRSMVPNFKPAPPQVDVVTVMVSLPVAPALLLTVTVTWLLLLIAWFVA